MSAEYLSPVQYKGEIMDFEFTLEMDHRKRRRNRATQSCLNCHTSKRKCDRKRPCQRCIQLGLTGLCVYEIDDPTLRDDPSLDENTRLRNRIAELESLVRELRGKPHPRWADANFRDGDPSERWHSRSSKRPQNAKKRTNSDEETDSVSPMSMPIKMEPVEAASETPQNHLYHISPSPGPSSPVHLHSLQSDIPTAGHFDHDHHHGYNDRVRDDSPYSQSQTNVMAYGDRHDPRISGGGNLYQMDHDRLPLTHQYPPLEPFCSCLTDPAAAHSYIGFSQNLQKTLDYIQQFPHHRVGSQCLLYRRMSELNNLMHGCPSEDLSANSYEGLGPCSETDTMSPVSTPSNSTLQTPVQEWNSLPNGHYNSSFLFVSSGDRSYDKGMAYGGVV